MFGVVAALLVCVHKMRFNQAPCEGKSSWNFFIHHLLLPLFLCILNFSSFRTLFLSFVCMWHCHLAIIINVDVPLCRIKKLFCTSPSKLKIIQCGCVDAFGLWLFCKQRRSVPVGVLWAQLGLEFIKAQFFLLTNNPILGNSNHTIRSHLKWKMKDTGLENVYMQWYDVEWTDILNLNASMKIPTCFMHGLR